MATEAQLARERQKRRELAAQLQAVEEMNGYQTKSLGARTLKVGLTAGTSATAGAISDVELGPVKLKWLNYGIGTIGAVGQVFSEPDGAGDVASSAAAGFLYGQLGAMARGEKKPATP